MPPPEQPQEAEIRIGSALGDLATVSHQKADIPLITISKDRFDMMVSPISSLSSNFFTMMVGTVLAIFLALKSGGVEEDWRATFWLALWLSLVLMVFFGLLTAAQEWRKHQFRKQYKTAPAKPIR